MEDYNFFPQEFHLSLLDVDDEEFLSHDIASTLKGKRLQQSLSSESYSFHSAKTPSNPFTEETNFERHLKQTKTIKSSCDLSSITENFSPKLSPSSSFSSSQSQILSFENSNSKSSSPPTNTAQFYGFDCSLSPKQNELGNMHFSAQTPKGSSKNQNFETKTSQQRTNKRSPAHAQDHIMAERKRREKISQSFIALAALLPGLKKMDKASVLADAIKHVKELKERLALLEEELSKKTEVESVVVLKKTQDDDSSSCDESIDTTDGRGESSLQVEARVSEKEMLLRIHCQRQKGLLPKILAEIQSLHLFVVNSSVLPFGDSILDITIIAQMGEGYNLTTKALVKNLREAILKLNS